MKDTTTGIKVALLIILITFAYLFCVTFLPMTDDGAEQAKTITPFLLGTVIGTLVGFYYGNKHDEGKGPALSSVDTAAVEAAQTKAATVVEAAKIEVEKEVTNATV